MVLKLNKVCNVSKLNIRGKNGKIDKDELIKMMCARTPEGRKYTHSEMAAQLGVSRGAVTAMIPKIPEEIVAKRNVENYREARAELFADLQKMILTYITPQKLKQSSLQQLGNLFKMFYEKEKVELGQVTDTAVVIHKNRLDKETIAQIEEAIGSATAKRLAASRKESLALAKGEYLKAV